MAREVFTVGTRNQVDVDSMNVFKSPRVSTKMAETVFSHVIDKEFVDWMLHG